MDPLEERSDVEVTTLVKDNLLLKLGLEPRNYLSLDDGVVYTRSVLEITGRVD